jgi:hypothetical protein
MDLDDSLSMTIFELEKGIATITQSEELFDCFAAINAAFAFTKSYYKQGQELDENENEEEIDNAPEEKVETLEYKEFGMFLHALKQYYVYCQVFILLT